MFRIFQTLASFLLSVSLVCADDPPPVPVPLSVPAPGPTNLPTPFYRMIEGIDGSLLRLTIDPNEQLPVGSTYVLVCLENKVVGPAEKAFSIGADPAPRAFVPQGEANCRSVAPGPQKLTFWTSTPSAQHNRSMSLRLDLSLYRAHVLRMQWLADGSG